VASRRIRFVNTDQGAMHVASSVPFRVVAIDGIDVHGPTTLAPSTYVEVPAAGRVDLVLDGAATSARVGVVGGASLVLGGGTAPFTARKPLDPLHYGAPDPSLKTPRPDRRFNYVIGQRRGYLDGKYGNWFTIDHELIPNVPMFMVKPGDTVRVRFKNNTFVDHPMHLHGQHMLVLSRNGHASKGSPWWVDTLEVHPGETYIVQITADNPGVWMFHCHILAHAAEGLMTHLSYLNVHDPYRVGAVNHLVTNHPA
jgi:FtsP/CotA-like multicopper oxidase with cupredoxin domain